VLVFIDDSNFVQPYGQMGAYISTLRQADRETDIINVQSNDFTTLQLCHIMCCSPVCYERIQNHMGSCVIFTPLY